MLVEIDSSNQQSMQYSIKMEFIDTHGKLPFTVPHSLWNRAEKIPVMRFHLAILTEDMKVAHLLAEQKCQL